MTTGEPTTTAAGRLARPRPVSWPVQVFRPFPDCDNVVFARTAARTDAFGPTSAAAGAPVVIGSAAGPSADDATPRARSELLERMQNILSARVEEQRADIVASFDELRRSGRLALDPLSWPEITDPGWRQSLMLWVRGFSLIEGDEVLVPASAVFLRHRPPPQCRGLLLAGSPGLAAHQDPISAVRHAALEILERDLLARAWYDGAERMVLPDTFVPEDLRRPISTLELRCTAFLIPGPEGSGCVAVALTDAEGGRQSFGARAVPTLDDESLVSAVGVAVYEALMVRWSMRTGAAAAALAALRGRADRAPLDPIQHSVHAYHHQNSLAVLLEGSTPYEPGWIEELDQPGPEVTSVLAEYGGDDVVAVPTTLDLPMNRDTVVMRVVAPAVRRLPADERTESALHPDAPPHPFG
ncbi:hypothetical protein C1701_24195 [Actinoalloteichus sp. AHMU CJ021]|uniref:Ribosomal protein S12 methylthiotransferase accessory factor n=1 Tax=Actinoalloteichus caeruleus DSM 43889 TaxID=1120930 RepID=A0ABT1JCZ4_ACTCY|nr:YcaO-like family protein [Actinoalloteichus caeruleus]AUS80925.1 hypothetical protein C1701_24195 [Actinoalloteichus sp. AHMU CJ021]MCP2330367.1 ribosomal protein S12 methylthiotransferase accessory factor [Actinoalloteichus caeruleus DSM 43889]